MVLAPNEPAWPVTELHNKEKLVAEPVVLAVMEIPVAVGVALAKVPPVMALASALATLDVVLFCP